MSSMTHISAIEHNKLITLFPEGKVSDLSLKRRIGKKTAFVPIPGGFDRSVKI